MKFIVGNDIKVEDPSRELIDWAKNNLVIDNPEYIKKQKMGKWTGKTPKKIFLYESNFGSLKLPFGCFRSLYALFPSKTLFEADFKPVERCLYNSNIKLYDYQKQAVEEALMKKNGVVVMPCGSGKTQTALEIVSRIGGKCLWLTHTEDLLNQSMGRAKACYDVPPYFFGTITGGKVNIGTITFATVQTMCNIDLNKYKYAFDIIVVDECHKCVGSPTNVMMFYKVLSSLSCRYKFGLTATPKRADCLERSMFALLGDIIIEITKEVVSKTTCPVEVKFIETGYMPDLDIVLAGDGTINYASLIDDLIHNERRFEAVLSVVESVSDEGAILVLGNRVEYLERLQNAYRGKSVCLSGLGNSKRAKEERKSALARLNDGDLNCIFATYQLAKEGLDVPNLRFVVFATPEKDPTTIEQSTGRVGRKADGKDYGTVIDFVDDFGMYKGWAKKRRNIYKKLGMRIVE